MLIDEQEHANDTALVKQIGITDFPTGLLGPGDYDSIIRENGYDLSDWLNDRRTDFYRNASSRPYSHYLEPFKLAMPFGWPLLALLTGDSNAIVTSRLLRKR